MAERVYRWGWLVVALGALVWAAVSTRYKQECAFVSGPPTVRAPAPGYHCLTIDRWTGTATRQHIR